MNNAHKNKLSVLLVTVTRLIVGIFVLINGLLIITPAEAHTTGFTHHETVFKYEKGNLIASYNLNLSYTDFKDLYPKVDQNQDGFISYDEGKTWLDTWKNNFSVETDNQKLAPKNVTNFPSKAELDPVLFPKLSFEVDFGKVNLSDKGQDFKITNTYRISNDPNEYWAASDDQKSLEFDLRNIEVVDQFSISGRWKSILPDNTALTNNETDLKNNSTNPANLVMFTNSYQNATNFINQILKDPNLSLVTVLILAVLGFIVGAAHSLTPGHGKTIIGSYLAAVKGNFKDALLMAFATTLSHTGSVTIIAFLFLWLKSGLEINFGFFRANLNFDLKAILPYFEIISGIGIIILGFHLLRRRISDFVDHKIRQAKGVPDISTLSNESQKHQHLHDHSHSHSDHSHTHHIPHHKINLKESFMIGFSTGLSPCLDAIAILILAINFDRIWIGMMFLFSFSIGMALTLAGVGYAIGHGVKHGSKYLKNDDVIQYIPLISAVIIIILGVLTLVQVYR